MIISDLSHFEEVVSEAPSIVGGAANKKTTFITAYQLISKELRVLLPDDIIADLKDIKVKVETVTAKKKGVSATVKTGTAKVGKGSISYSSSSSSASA